MDRRRYVPSTEGLEGRDLMTSVNTLFGIQVTTNLNMPITLQQKELRIEHLPVLPRTDQPRPVSSQDRDQGNPVRLVQHDRRHRQTSRRCAQQFQLPASLESLSKQSLSASDIALLNHGVSGGLERRHTLLRLPSTASRMASSRSPRRSTRPAYSRCFWGPTTIHSCCRPLWPSAVRCRRRSSPESRRTTAFRPTPTTSRRRSCDRPWWAPTTSTPSFRSSRPRASWWEKPTAHQKQQLQSPDHDAAERGHPRVPAASGR